MTMWKSGELDANVAMQLLGQGMSGTDSKAVNPHGTPNGSSLTANEPKKRPFEDVDGNGSNGIGEDDLTEVLDQAKRAKNETWTKLNICIISLNPYFVWPSRSELVLIKHMSLFIPNIPMFGLEILFNIH